MVAGKNQALKKVSWILLAFRREDMSHARRSTVLSWNLRLLSISHEQDGCKGQLQHLASYNVHFVYRWSQTAQVRSSGQILGSLTFTEGRSLSEREKSMFRALVGNKTELLPHKKTNKQANKKCCSFWNLVWIIHRINLLLRYPTTWYIDTRKANE